MTTTIFIIAITAITSIIAFNNQELKGKFLFYPNGMNSPSEYYRFISHGLIHADLIHLFFNMYALYFFGRATEYYITSYTGKPYLFVVMYVLALIASSLPSFAKHRNNYYYTALGASGAVAAVIFSSVYYNPWMEFYVWFIPMNNILFAIIYLVYSAYMAKKGTDNIGHDAHFYGAIFGFVFTFLFDPTHGRLFIQQLSHPHFNFF